MRVDCFNNPISLADECEIFLAHFTVSSSEEYETTRRAFYAGALIMLGKIKEESDNLKSYAAEIDEFYREGGLCSARNACCKTEEDSITAHLFSENSND